MKRNRELLNIRMKLVGLFFELKRSQNKTSKTSRTELAEIFGVCVHTINNDLTKYRKTLTNDTKKNE